MKQILILITIIFFPIDLFSQEECALFHDQGVTLEKARPSEPINLYEKYIPTEPRKIGLTIHIVRDDGGTGGIFLQDVTNAVIYLNNVFVGAKIKFIVDNIKYINSNYYYCIDDTTEARKLMNHDVVYNTLNIYFVPCVNAGFTGAAKLPGTSMILLNSAATTSTLPHEIGHNLWLYHTHETKFGRENIGDIDDPVPLSEDIPTCPPNCNIAGDLICDTPADAEPLLFLSGCKYRWDVKAFDNCGRTDYKPDFLNFMSYNTPNCRNRFTRQQVGRMHWALETHNDLRPLIEVHTIVSNLVDDMNIAGSSLTINNTNYFSGQPAPLLDGKEYYGRTNHERFENFSGGRTIKHNNWDNNKNQFYLLEKFQVKKERPKRDAIFLDGNSVTIKNELIDAPSLNVGSVEFRDPWYLHDAAGNQHNRFDSFPSPYIPTGAYNKNTGGVFLNQRVQDGVYYTVRVPLSQWIGNFQSQFLGWQALGANLVQVEPNPTGYDQKAVVFTSSNAVVKAKYQATLASINAQVLENWNLVSIPYDVASIPANQVYQAATSQVFGFENGSYIVKTDLKTGEGYFVKFGNSRLINYTGAPIFEGNFSVQKGWNILGSISVPVSTSTITTLPLGIIISPFYKYENGYVITDKIEPGGGYWVKVNQSGSLILKAIPWEQQIFKAELANLDRFTITDSEGNSQNLYVRNGSLSSPLEGLDFEMPPPPVGASFDARFITERSIETVYPEDGETELAITVGAESYPITVSWEINPNNGIDYSVGFSSGGLGKNTLRKLNTESGSFVISNGLNNKIALKGNASKIAKQELLPTDYLLGQNHPNPFNPLTVVNYQLPIDNWVTLKVYDVLGREVATVVDEFKPAGYYEVSFNAEQLSSGVYFYRFVSGNYTAVKKLLITK